MRRCSRAAGPRLNARSGILPEPKPGYVDCRETSGQRTAGARRAHPLQKGRRVERRWVQQRLFRTRVRKGVGLVALVCALVWLDLSFQVAPLAQGAGRSGLSSELWAPGEAALCCRPSTLRRDNAARAPPPRGAQPTHRFAVALLSSIAATIARSVLACSSRATAATRVRLYLPALAQPWNVIRFEKTPTFRA